MPNYRRAVRPGGTFFFTVVTYRRARFLTDPLARRLLRNAVEACRAEFPFVINAWVLLPDHLHAIWTLPENDTDYSKRWGLIKKAFTQPWTNADGWEGAVSDSRVANRRRGVWQRRFWEHTLRDEADYERHLDYLHYNPIKHGHAACAHAWQWSTFERMVRDGVYPHDWCCTCDDRPADAPDFAGIHAAALEADTGE